MAKKNSPGCGCCETCDVFADPFDRADDTNIGSDWSEASGAWEIASALLKATSNGIAVYDTVLPQATYQVRAVVRTTTSGDQIGLVAYFTDTSNYYSVIVTIGTGATLKLFKTSGGSTTELASKNVTAAINTNHIVKLCVSMSGSDVRLTAVVNNDKLTRTDTGTDLSGPGKAGCFRKSASGTTTWDEFEIVKTEDDCDPCELECACSGEVPAQIQVTIASVPGFCSSFNGTYTLNHDNRCDSCVWSYYQAAGTCSLSHVWARLSGTTLFVAMSSVTCGPNGFDMTFSGTVSADCASWSGQDVPRQLNGSCCGSPTAQTCTVTAL